MNFEHFLSDQQKKLKCTKYLSILWQELSGQECNVETCFNYKESYDHHIPFEFNSYLFECAEKLRNLINEHRDPVWKEVDTQYLFTMLYYAMKLEDTSDPNESIPLLAANVYFLFNSFYVNETAECSLPFSKLLEISLEVFSQRLCRKYKLTKVIVKDLNLFLHFNSLPKHSKEIVDLLYEIILLDNKEIFKDFYCGKHWFF